jgi:hypothetical protein
VTVLNSSHRAVDYSQSLFTQRDLLHPSILMDSHDLDVWRVHPTWNNAGCLTFAFDSKSILWDDCRAHVKLKGGFGYDAQQSFFLRVAPHPELVERGPFESRSGGLRHVGTEYRNQPKTSLTATDGGSLSSAINTTRIMMPDREPLHWDDQPGRFKCLTVEGEMVTGAAVTFVDCLADNQHRSQQFQTVRGLTRGSHPETTVGRIHFAAQPNLCVWRDDNKEKGLAKVAASGRLALVDCYKEAQQHRVLFEFELIA